MNGVCHYYHLVNIKQKTNKQTRSDYRSDCHSNAAPQYSSILYERYQHGKPLRQLRLLPQPDGKASGGQAIRWRYNDDD